MSKVDAVYHEADGSGNAEQEATKAKKTTKNLSSLVYLLSYLKPYKLRWLGAMMALIFTASLTLLMGQGVKLLIDSGFGEGSLSLLNQAVLVLLALAVLMQLVWRGRFDVSQFDAGTV